MVVLDVGHHDTRGVDEEDEGVVADADLGEDGAGDAGVGADGGGAAFDLQAEASQLVDQGGLSDVGDADDHDVGVWSAGAVVPIRRLY